MWEHKEPMRRDLSNGRFIMRAQFYENCAMGKSAMNCVVPNLNTEAVYSKPCRSTAV